MQVLFQRRGRSRRTQRTRRGTRRLKSQRTQRTQRKDDAGEITENTEDTQRNTEIEITKDTKDTKGTKEEEKMGDGEGGARGAAPCLSPTLPLPFLFLFPSPFVSFVSVVIFCVVRLRVSLCVLCGLCGLSFGVKKGPRPGGRGLFGVCAGVIRRRGFPQGFRRGRRGWR